MASNQAIALVRKALSMAKEDTRQVQVARTTAGVTITRASSEPETPTEPQVARSAAASPPADPMVAWLEAGIAQVQYSSPEWQWLTGALLQYQGLKANGEI